MDTNGLRFWLLADAAHWPSRSHTTWHADCRTLRLASERRLAAPVDPAAFAAANTALEVVPRALDLHDAVARWDPGAAAIVVRSHLPDDAVRLPLPETPSDLAVGPDGVLYVALDDRVHLHDLRGRWADEAVRLAGFAPWRIEADAGGLWVLERAGRLARLTGAPLRATTPQRDDYAPGVFRPDPENCRPPALRMWSGVAWPAGERPIALAAHPVQRPRSAVVVRRRRSPPPAARRRLRTPDGAAGPHGCAIRLRAGVAGRRTHRRPHAREARCARVRSDRRRQPRTRHSAKSIRWRPGLPTRRSRIGWPDRRAIPRALRPPSRCCHSRSGISPAAAKRRATRSHPRACARTCWTAAAPRPCGTGCTPRPQSRRGAASSCGWPRQTRPSRLHRQRPASGTRTGSGGTLPRSPLTRCARMSRGRRGSGRRRSCPGHPGLAHGLPNASGAACSPH